MRRDGKRDYKLSDLEETGYDLLEDIVSVFSLADLGKRLKF
jgi:hypothetical protein